MRKIKTKILLIFSLITLIIFTLVLGYMYWLKTPQYSLLQIKKAVDNHDLKNFKKYVDIDMLITGLVDQAVNLEMNKLNFISGSLKSEIGERIKPKIAQYTKNEIISYFEKNNSEEALKNYATISLFNFSTNTALKSLHYKGIEEIEKKDNSAFVKLKFYNKKSHKNLILNIKMRKLTNYWQVYKLTNTEAIMNLIEKEVIYNEINKLKKPLVNSIKKIFSYENIKGYLLG